MDLLLAGLIRLLFVVAFLSCCGRCVTNKTLTTPTKADPTYSCMMVDKQRNIIVDWTPKSACSKVVEMFYEQMGIHRGVHYTGFVHAYRVASQPKATVVTESMLYSPIYYKFKVTRNPYDRAVSSYIHVMITKLKDTIFRDVKEYMQNKSNTSFTRFLEWFLESKDFQEGGHFTMQSHEHEHKRLQQGMSTIFNRIVKVEDFDSERHKVGEYG